MLPKNIHLLDPLGEISQRAKELWRIAGQPSNKTWEDYWEEAENDLLAGKSSKTVATSHPVKPKRKTSHSPVKDPQELSRQKDPLKYFITTTFGEKLSEIEVLSLNLILSTKKIELVNGQSITPLDTLSIAELVAELAFEYDKEFFTLNNSTTLESIAFEQKVNYWIDKFNQQTDHALTYAERNTLARFTELLAESNLVAKILDAS